MQVQPCVWLPPVEARQASPNW
eukprot:COSAG01_NODE_77779_length_158_cov_9.711864_1_plen_21_part_01